MEMFQAPLREIQDRFTKSELVILGWRSAEQAYKMRLRMHRPSKDEDDDKPVFEGEAKTEAKAEGKKKTYADADTPENLPDRFYDEEGEVNLSKTTLRDAVQYMNAIGIKMPVPMPGTNQYGAKLKAAQESLPTMDELF